MKFGKELNRNLVPEWRPKYFDYRTGKKHIKLIIRATNCKNDLGIQPYFAEKCTELNEEECVSPLSTKTDSHALQERQRFLDWLDAELEKIEAFYKTKETQAERRLEMLRHQLHEMRRQRIGEIQPNQPATEDRKMQWSWHYLFGKVFGKSRDQNSPALEMLPPSPSYRREYVRKDSKNMPYQVVKQQLEVALQELYRSLELLKSYTDMNQTAFRKLNKKYDKAVNSPSKLGYYYKKVRTACFVKSDKIDNCLITIEDLYTRYIEQGQRKHAIAKLRALNNLSQNEGASVLRNGIYIGASAIFFFRGLNHAAQLLADPDPLVRSQTEILLQIYGGYFTILYMFILFTLSCSVWIKHRVNYPFIFEFDRAHQLPFPKMAEFAGLFTFLLAVISWIDFDRQGPDFLYIFWPILLIGLTVVIIFLPLPILAHNSRKWFVTAQARVILAGLFPVEFRDVFFGDLLSSLTFPTGYIELFFCNYQSLFKNPTPCDSRHSELLGFLTAVPAILRLLQCLRRWNDSKEAFPHLANAGKYALAVVFNLLLSRYRITGHAIDLALVVTFAVTNSVVNALWDVFMDFSLVSPDSSLFSPSLRPVRALGSKWIYITIAIVDVILRFSWIPLVLCARDPQRASIIAFLVAIVEVTRRGMWMLIRVENEHCANVGKLQAWREVQVPYEIFSIEDLERELVQGQQALEKLEKPGFDLEHGLGRRSSLGRPSLGRRLTNALANAHGKDFEKRRRPSSRSSFSTLVEEDDEIVGGGVSWLNSDADDVEKAYNS